MEGGEVLVDRAERAHTQHTEHRRSSNGGIFKGYIT